MKRDGGSSSGTVNTGVRAERSEALNTSITVPKLLPPPLFEPIFIKQIVRSHYRVKTCRNIVPVLATAYPDSNTGISCRATSPTCTMSFLITT